MLLEAHFTLIERRLRSLSRCGGLPAHEADEFFSWALYKLIEHDYRALSSWEGRSSFSTYVAVVLVRLLQDYRTHLWGKWRPSAAARRQGEEAVALERLLVRDGHSLEEAIRRMCSGQKNSLSSAELERIAIRLPQRTRRRWVGQEALREIPVDGRAEARVEAGERAKTTARLNEALPALLRALPEEDLRLLDLHYGRSLSMAAISPLLGKPQRVLYALRDRCLNRLRRGLEEAGLRMEQVRELLADRSSTGAP